MSATGDLALAVEALAAEAGIAFGEVSAVLRDGVTVARVHWPSLAIVALERYDTPAEARTVAALRTIDLMRP